MGEISLYVMDELTEERAENTYAARLAGTKPCSLTPPLIPVGGGNYDGDMKKAGAVDPSSK